VTVNPSSSYIAEVFLFFCQTKPQTYLEQRERRRDERWKEDEFSGRLDSLPKSIT